MRKIEERPTLQSVHLGATSLPLALPIVLKRFSYDKEAQRPTKQTTRIIPSETIDFPLAGEESKKARYELKSIVIHDGSTPRGGHYYTYVPCPSLEEQQKSYIEFDDSSVRRHEDAEKSKKGIFKTVHEDVCKNGYIFFYQFKQFV